MRIPDSIGQFGTSERCQNGTQGSRTIVFLGRLFCDFADNAAWVSCGKHALWNVPCHHASSPNHRSVPNTHARQNNCSAAYPNVRPDDYRSTELFSTALLGVEWMHRSVDLHRRAKEGEAADLHWTNVEHDAVEVEENRSPSLMLEP